MKNSQIILHEVGLRDGIQIEEKIVPTQKKIEWINTLIGTGIDIIQLGSFVNLKKVPQMADTDELFRYFINDNPENHSVTFSALVLNEKGLERGLACGVEYFCMGASASETHSLKNTGMGTDEAVRKIISMAVHAGSKNKKIQLSVQSAFGCGYEGMISEEKVLNIVRKYLDAGFKTISLADTAGHANPEQVKRLFSAILKDSGKAEFACHFHNTYGMGLTNCFAAFEMGVKYFESSFAGLGGCPFTALASGNVCTEDLVHMLSRMNLRADIQMDRLIEVSKDAEKFFGRELPGIIYKT